MFIAAQNGDASGFGEEFCAEAAVLGPVGAGMFRTNGQGLPINVYFADEGGAFEVNQPGVGANRAGGG